VEALVAAALAGVALASLATTGALAVRTLRLARDNATALALASGRLEALRGGPRIDGTDASTAADGTLFGRAWEVHDGRGGAAHLDVTVRWSTHAVALGSQAFP
jgi:hypothetical protein